MNRIFDDAKDVHVRATYTYNKGSDTKLYVDPDCETQIMTSELTDLFNKGMIVVIDDVQYKPVSFTVDAGVASVTIVKADSGTATTAVLTVLSAAADPEEA